MSGESIEHASLMITASQDGTVKLWDKRVESPVSKLEYMRKPFFSVATNKQLLAAGQDSEIVMWDLRRMKIT